MNGDRRLDVALASQASPKLRVFLSNASAGFDKPLDVDLGNSPDYLAIGDVNNDGKPDLLATVQNAVRVVLNTP